jgi:signal transduction histidine kinase
VSAYGRLLRAPHLSLLLVVALVVVSLEVVLFRTYAQMTETADAHALSAGVPLNLANVQREALGLHIELSKAAHDDVDDLEPVRVRRALLLHQIRIAKASAAHQPEIVRLLDDVSDRVDRAMAVAVAAGGTHAEADRLLEGAVDDVARMFSREEQRSIAQTGADIAVERRTGLVLLVIGGLLLALGAMLAWSLWRHLRVTLARLAPFTELNPTPLVKLAADGSIAFSNPAARSLAAELTAGDVGALFPSDYRESLEAALAGGSVERREHRIGDRTLVWSFFPVAAEGAVHCYGEDVTEWKELEEQLRQSQRLDAIGQLAGGVAHDFNNLLTAIRGNGELTLARLNGDDGGLRRGVEEIIHASERAAELTGKLLTFARKQVLAPQVVDANEVLGGIVSLLQRLLGERIHLRTLLAPRELPVYVDRSQMEQVVVNLAVNARDAMPAGGTLTIETTHVELDPDQARRLGCSAGEHIAVAVRDTGIGMDAATREQAFQPFFTTKPVGEGTGLGLSTVHGIVSQNGGVIRLTSEPGDGAEFTIYLPSRSRPPEPVAPT